MTVHTVISPVYQEKNSPQSAIFPYCAWGFSHLTAININGNCEAWCRSATIFFPCCSIQAKVIADLKKQKQICETV